MTGALLHVRHGPPEDADATDRWWHCADLLTQPGGLANWRAMIAGWLADRYGEAPEMTVDGYLVTWYLAAPARLAALMFQTRRRVPSLAPEDLALRLAALRPRPDGVAVLDDGFACLPADPAAGTGPATVVGDEAALAALLRGRFIAHAARFIAAFGPLTRFGRRTLWAAATDALDEAMWLTGRQLGNECAGAAAAALVLPTVPEAAPEAVPEPVRVPVREAVPVPDHGPDGIAPLTSPSTVRMAPEMTSEMTRGLSERTSSWTRRRESCCFHYALRAGLGPCDTCPRLCGRGQV